MTLCADVPLMSCRIFASEKGQPLVVPERGQQQVNMLGHHHRRVQIDLLSVIMEAMCQNDVPGLR